jgi:hypothetical protein
LLDGTPIAECVEKAFGKMQIGAMKRTSIRISYPVRNVPSAEQLRDTARVLHKALYSNLTIG